MITIGIIGVTIPGAADCLAKIGQKSHHYFPSHQHPNIILHQSNFAPTHEAQINNRWDIVTDRLVESIKIVEKEGADFVIIPANTMHKVIGDLRKRTSLPILSMLEVVADACKSRGLTKIGILGTRWTMSDHLYGAPLERRGITEVIPSEADQATIQEAIFSELVPTGTVSPATLKTLLEVVKRMKKLECDGIWHALSSRWL